MPGATSYIDFADFTLWLLRVGRVRWYGGYGQMDVVTGADYAAAQADPLAPHAARAIAHLNADHAESLRDIARNLAGFPTRPRRRAPAPTGTASS